MPHHCEVLPGQLWPNGPEPLASTVLRAALANLHQGMGTSVSQAYEVVMWQGVQFDLDRGALAGAVRLK